MYKIVIDNKETKTKYKTIAEADAAALTIKQKNPNAYVIVTVPLLETTPNLSSFEFKLQEHLDKVANSFGYDDIKTAAMRATYSGPYQAEGIKFAQWMDTCWNLLYTSNYKSIEEMLESLPVLEKE